jgi:DNA (cytosine-5)-methyltransferase 1
VAVSDGINTGYRRESDTSKPKGYNIVTGKLSFPYSQILDPNDYAPTLVAMDMHRIGVVDGDGIRHLTISEGLKLFGFSNYDLSYLETQKYGRQKAFDLLGNSVCVPVIQVIASRLLQTLLKKEV